MGIPVGVRYTTTLTGRVVKHVCCEQCKYEYVYQMERLAVGDGTSVLFIATQQAKQVSADNAQRALANSLENECDPVPCPACGWYQEPMCKLLKKRHQAWMFISGCCLFAVSFVASIALFINVMSLWYDEDAILYSALIAGISFVVGLALVIVRKVRASHFDPNLSPIEERQTIAAQRAIPRAEYEAYQVVQEAAAAEAQERAAERAANRWDFLDK